MLAGLTSWLRDESAISAVEYSAILAFVCVAIIMACLELGEAVLADYTQAANEISGGG
jgi:Flp pilus assembly pilin Flp